MLLDREDQLLEAQKSLTKNHSSDQLLCQLTPMKRWDGPHKPLKKPGKKWPFEARKKSSPVYHGYGKFIISSVYPINPMEKYIKIIDLYIPFC